MIVEYRVAREDRLPVAIDIGYLSLGKSSSIGS